MLAFIITDRELVDISTAPIRDPFLLKYGTPSMEVAFERYRQAQSKFLIAFVECIVGFKILSCLEYMTSLDFELQIFAVHR